MQRVPRPCSMCHRGGAPSGGIIMRRLAIALLALGLLAPAWAQAQDKPAGKKPVPQITLDQSAMDKLGWRLASQAYTFRKLTLFETIDLLSAMGIRYIEMYPGQRFSPERPDLKADHNMPQERIDELTAKLKSANVTPLLYGVVNLPNNEAESRKVFDYAKK